MLDVGGVKRTKPIPPHRLLKEVYKNYITYREYVATHGKDIIEYGYFLYNEDGTPQRNADGTPKRVIVTISFWDLFYGLKELSPRKREAFWFNVIMDKKQREVAEIMGISTVTVGQYVENSTLMLSKRYFYGESESSEEEPPISFSVDGESPVHPEEEQD